MTGKNRRGIEKDQRRHKNGGKNRDPKFKKVAERKKKKAKVEKALTPNKSTAKEGKPCKRLRRGKKKWGGGIERGGQEMFLSLTGTEADIFTFTRW